jgi:hypothetical protein
LRNDLRGLDLHGRYPNLLLIDNLFGYVFS